MKIEKKINLFAKNIQNYRTQGNLNSLYAKKRNVYVRTKYTTIEKDNTERMK